MNSYYLNQRVLQGQKYTNMHLYRYINSEEGQHCIIAVGNSIELYRVFIDGLSLLNRYAFQANILKLEVIPSQNHPSDYVWILDQRGRFGCWNPQKGLEVVSNEIFLDGHCQGQSSKALATLSVQVMSGLTCDFQDYDTVGSIFLTVQRKLLILEFVLRKQGLIIGKISEETIADDIQIRYIDWIRNSSRQCYLGIISQKNNQLTTLHVYRFVAPKKILASKAVWQFQKNNLLHFRSLPNGDILITSFDQVSLHGFKMSHPLRCYRTKGHYGQGFCLSDGYFGHYGKELVIFSKDKLRTFPPFHFPNENVTEGGAFIESKKIGHFQRGTMIVGLISHLYEVYLLVISEKQCEVIKHNKGVLSVSSFRGFQSYNDKFAIVGNSSQSLHQVILVQTIESLTIQNQQTIPYVVDTLVSVIGGNYLFVGCHEVSFVLRLTRNGHYQLYFYLPLGQIITAKDNLLVLNHGVFQIDYQTQSYTQVFTSQIVLSQIVEENVYFLTGKGTLTVWNNSNDQVKVLDETRKADYCWGYTLLTSALIVANIETPYFLKLFSDQGAEKVQIKGHTLVSSLSSVTYRTRKQHMRMNGNLDEQLLIGYSDGQIHLQTHNGVTLSTFSLFCSNLVTFERIKQNEIFVLCGSKHYLLTYQKTGCKISEVHLSSNQGRITSLAAVEKKSWMLYLEEKEGIQTLKVANLLNRNIDSQFTTLETMDSLPFVLTRQESIIIVGSQKIQEYDLHSKTIKKEGSHTLQEVNAIDEIMKGIIIAGVSIADMESVVILNQFFETIHTFQLDIKRPLKAIKSVHSTNNFFLFSETKVTLNKIQPSGYLKTLFGSQLQIQVSTVDICQQSNKLMINDSQRYCSLFEYDNSITQIANFLPIVDVVHASYIGDNLMISDSRGKLQFFVLDWDQVLFHRSIFVKKASLQLGAPVIQVIKRRNDMLLFSEDMSIFRVQLIERDEFDILSRLQQQCIVKGSQGGDFEYWPWREKTNWDRIIDGDLLELKMKEKSEISQEVKDEWNYVMSSISI